ncbi:hypothetical protein [Paenibacillus graminis]
MTNSSSPEDIEQYKFQWRAATVPSFLVGEETEWFEAVKDEWFEL